MDRIQLQRSFGPSSARFQGSFGEYTGVMDKRIILV